MAFWARKVFGSFKKRAPVSERCGAGSVMRMFLRFLDLLPFGLFLIHRSLGNVGVSLW